MGKRRERCAAEKGRKREKKRHAVKQELETRDMPVSFEFAGRHGGLKSTSSRQMMMTRSCIRNGRFFGRRPKERKTSKKKRKGKRAKRELQQQNREEKHTKDLAKKKVNEQKGNEIGNNKKWGKLKWNERIWEREREKNLNCKK